ncbi:MAG: hypothetical protein GXO18_04580 [Aquificae bacterium]|nr:hypothetical protein [Aquificota bacterium]
MGIKEALESSYKEVKTPEGVEYRVLSQIEKHKRRRWMKIAFAEMFLIVVVASVALFAFFKPAEYETMGVSEAVVKVVIKEDISLRKLSEELTKYNLTIEGPYDGSFYISGDEEKIKEFLEKHKNVVAVKENKQ